MIATDAQGIVVMAGSNLPTEWNGIVLTLHELTDEQQAVFDALPARVGTLFDGEVFTAIPLPTPSNNENIATQILAIEVAQPITQRSIRELMLAIGQAFPAAQSSVFYKKAAAQEGSVSALRDQLT